MYVRPNGKKEIIPCYFYIIIQCRGGHRVSATAGKQIIRPLDKNRHYKQIVPGSYIVEST